MIASSRVMRWKSISVWGRRKRYCKGNRSLYSFNTGAYGEHGPTTVGLSGHKSIALYRHTEAYRFAYDVVYTNMQAAGAYRGYGATQGIFAVESAADELAHKMGMDPVKFRELNMPMEGEALPGYPDVPINSSCTMDKCLARAKEMIGWDEKYPFRDMGNGKVRGVGIAMAMQGSSIGIDVGGADIKLNEDGSIPWHLDVLIWEPAVIPFLLRWQQTVWIQI